LYVDPQLGRFYVPPALLTGVSRRGAPTKPEMTLREIGIFFAKAHRPIVRDDGKVVGQELFWHSFTFNERVDAGAAIQANRVFGTSGTTANGVFTAVAVGSANFSKTKTDLSIGSASANVTTNEFTTIGLSRATGTVSTYTAPSSLGGTFSQLITKTFNVSGSGTAYGAALFDQVTVSGSNLYVEDLFSTSAAVANGETLTVQITITN
jgi:hypothetical protein